MDTQDTYRLKMQMDDTEDRYIDLADILLATYFGSFWWINENWVKATFQRESVAYDQCSERKGHPHVSILERNLAGRGPVPFLLGSSRGDLERDFSVLGLTHTEPQHITYFGRTMQPVCLSHRDMLQRDPDAAHNPQRGPNESAKNYAARVESSLVGPAWERSVIWPNWDRLRTNETETAALKLWLQERDLL